MKVEYLPSGKCRVKKIVNGVTHRMTFDKEPTQRELVAWLNEVLQESYCKDSFKMCTEEYIKNRSNVLSPSSIRTYNNFLKVISDDFLRLPIYSIKQSDIQKEMDRYAVDHAPKSVRSLHGFISSVFGSYRPSFHLATTLPQKESKRQYRPNKSDIDRILEYEQGKKYALAIKLGILGLRRCEVSAITSDDLDGNKLIINKSKVYDGKNWIIKKTPKTDASNRVIPLPQELADEIRQAKIVHDGCPKALINELYRAQDALGIPRFKFHDLRRYFASYASTLGIPEQDIMYLGGWESDFVFKKIYRESMEDSVKKSADTIMKNMF